MPGTPRGPLSLLLVRARHSQPTFRLMELCRGAVTGDLAELRSAAPRALEPA